MSQLFWIREACGLLAGFFLPLLGLTATAYALGRTVTRRLPFAGRLERGAVSLALGLALAAHLLLLLGLAGLLKPLPILLVAAAIHALGRSVWKEVAADLHGIRWRLAWGFLLCVPLLLFAHYPPTGYDETMYHLPFAKAFVASGGVPILYDRRFPVFPQANEILFAAVMMFGRDVAAHGVQVLATLLCAALLAAWGRLAIPAYPAAGWLAPAIFLGNPIVVHLAGSGYIEPGLTLFTAATLFAVDRWRRGGGKGWLVLAGVFGATAADVKYLGLFFLGVAGLVVILAGGRTRPASARWRDAAWFTVAAAIFLAPWYLRIYLHTGNPIFPFAWRIFGANLWQSLQGVEDGQPLAHRLLRWVRLPWDVVFARQSYGQQPPFSPVYLAALPLLALGAWRLTWLRGWLLVAGVYAFFCMWLPPDSRYFVPALPMASLLVAGGVAVAAAGWPALASRRLAMALCLGCVLPGWLYAGYRMARQGPLPVTPAQRELYLGRHLRFYRALAFLNRTRGGAYRLWALEAENMPYHADGRFLGDYVGRATFESVISGLQGPPDLRRRLRRLGADHLLIPVASRSLPFPQDAEFRRSFALIYADPNARIYALRLGDAER